MKKLLFLLFPLISLAQSYNEKEALNLQNQFRSYHFIDTLTYCDTLEVKAKRWAKHLAFIDDLALDKDSIGSNVYRIQKITETISNNFNPALDATIFWITNESKLMLQQVLEPEASKIGIGIAENKNRYYVVAKYNNVIE
tara:strand:+ start:224 stop:643 length:420 start_codon:yes stop_codon:yes gene_type:complete